MKKGWLVGELRASQINIAQLVTFRRVMEEGGYAAAAKVSNLTVPSVWQHIRALESEYGVSLFQRKGRQVVPTQAALRLHSQVESILVHLESTFDLMSETPEDHPIRLVTGVRMLIEDLSQPLANFRGKHANPIVLRQGNDRRAEQLLLSDEADIGLALEPGARQTSPKIHYEPAYMVEFLAVAQKSHPIAKLKQVTLKALAKHDLVATTPGTQTRDTLDEAFHREGLKPRIVVETDNSAYTIACVSAGMGVGILAGRSDGALCEKLATRSMSRVLGSKRIVMMWRKGRVLTKPMLELVETLGS